MKYPKSTSLTLAIMLIPASMTPALAGTIVGLDSVEGDGFLLIDEDEGVVEPGVKAVTGDPNNDDFTTANGFSPQGVVNCLMASNTASCDSESGSGKRVKNNLTGLGAFDTIYNVVSSGGTTEYFNFGKLTNQTPARMTGFTIEIGTGSGDNFVPAAQGSEPLSMDQVGELLNQAADWAGNGGVDGQNPLQRAFFPDGLFGAGGQEGEIGYFSNPDKSGFVFVPDGTDTLAATSIFGAYTEYFGNGVLSRTQVPEAVFFDDDGDPATEGTLLYWKAGDLWLDGDGVVQDTAAVDALIAQDAYEVDIIEDLSNINLNYSLDIGDLSVGQFTVRFTPTFAPIVTAAQTEYQSAVAFSLDQTEIPYLFLDQSAAAGTEAAIDPIFADFQEVTGALNGLSSPEAIQQVLERAGTSYLRNFGTQAQLLGRDQLEQVLQHIGNGRGSRFATANNVDVASADNSTQAAAMMLAQANGGNSAQVSDRLTAFMSASVSTGDIKQSLNGAGADYTGYTIVGGADYRIVDSLRVGAALSYGKNEADVDDNRGELDASGLSLMAYASYGEQTGFYADVAGGHTWVDFDNDRTIVIGSLSRLAQSETDGKQWSIAARTGYNIDLAPVIIGPSVEYHFYDLDVDGYSETGAGALNMTIDDMEFKSQTIWLGAQASMPIISGNGVIEPHASVHWVKELDDEGFLVGTRFTEGVLPFFTPIDARDKEYARANIGVTGNFTTSSGLPIELSVNYDGTFGNADFSQHRFQLRAALRF